MAWWNGRSDKVTFSARRLAPKQNPSAENGDSYMTRLTHAGGSKWQEEAWGFYDALGEVKYPARYVGRACGRLIPYAAVIDEPDQDPIPLSEALDDPATAARLGVTQQVVDLCNAEVARVRSETGGISNLLQAAGINLFVPGEFYLVGVPKVATGTQPLPTPDTGVRSADSGDENWEVHSTSELRKQGDDWYVKDPGGSGQGQKLPADAVIVRIWTRHPRRVSWPDSSLLGAMNTCRDLLLCQAAIRSIATSRIAGSGVLMVAQELSFGLSDPTKTGPRAEEEGDPFLNDLMDTMETGIRDPGSPGAAVPIVARIPAELMDKAMKHWTLDRPIDAVLAAIRTELRGELAEQIDVPPEIMQGRSKANHWSAWAIDEDVYRGHIQPLAETIFDGWTTGLLRPALRAVLDPELVDRLCVWYSAANLVVRPNRATDFKDGYDRGVIKGASYRDAIGANDGDAPDEEELQYRKDMGTLGKPQSGTGDPNSPPNGGAAPNNSGLALGFPSTVEPNEIVAGLFPALIATTKIDPLTTLGARLGRIDTSLRERLIVAADAEMRRALERAGARVKAKTAAKNGKFSAIRDVIADIPVERVCATLGPSIVFNTGLTEDELLAEAFDSLESRWQSWTTDAASNAASEIAAATGLSAAAITATLMAHQSDSWVALRLSLADLAHKRLYDPSSIAPDLGEYDVSSTIPVSIARDALRIAGGGHAGDLSNAARDAGGRLIPDMFSVFGGLALGSDTLGAMSDAGVEPAEYTWTYGISSRSFEPHLELDGASFNDFTDDQLANNSGWPDVAYFMPGDHEGCNCDVTPTLQLADINAPLLDEPIAASGRN